MNALAASSMYLKHKSIANGIVQEIDPSRQRPVNERGDTCDGKNASQNSLEEGVEHFSIAAEKEKIGTFASVSVLRSGVDGAKALDPPFTGHGRVESGTEGAVFDRSDGAAPLEMTELDNDDVSLLNKGVHPFDCEKVVKIRAGKAPDRARAYSIRRC